MIGGESAYEERVTSHVMPCISQLALAVHDDSCWKSLNYQVLLKTRHNSPKVCSLKMDPLYQVLVTNFKFSMVLTQLFNIIELNVLSQVKNCSDL